jgi:hypothetical protein
MAMIEKMIHGERVRLADNARFYESGAIRGGSLLDDVTLTIGTQAVRFTSVAKAEHNVDYRDVTVPWNVFDIYFYESGNVKAGCMADDMELTVSGRPIRFSKGDYLGITFHESGGVKSGHLAEDTELYAGGELLLFKKGERIYFFESGALEGGTLAQTYTIGGNTFHAGGILTFSSQGEIKAYKPPHP